MKPVVINDAQMQLMADATLRRMDHVQWLTKLAMTLEAAPQLRGQQMSPFRSGAVERIRLAVKYIELLHKEARDDKRMIAALELHIQDLKRMIHDDTVNSEEGR